MWAWLDACVASTPDCFGKLHGGRIMCHRSAFAVIAFSAVVSGCALEQGVEPDPVYTETKVVLHLDGNHEVTTRFITRSQQLRQRWAKEPAVTAGELGTVSQALTQDTSCGYGVLIFWDQPDYSGNYICFTGTGSAQLSLFARGSSGNWASSKNSMYTNNWYGKLQRPIDCSTYFSFPSSTFYATMSTCNQNATYLHIDGP